MINLNFGGFIAPSTVDWFGVSTAVVFFRGCALGCKDCQNPTLLSGENIVSTRGVKYRILEAAPFISGVVFSGGEPCLQIDPLIDLLDWCRKHNLKTFLHTSGFHPYNLRRIIDKLDGVRIDFKPRGQLDYDKYESYCEAFVKSMVTVKSSNVEYWLSTVALRNNEGLKYVYKILDFDPKRILIVQGNEEHPKTVQEMKKEFPGCFLYTKEEGLKWNE